LIIKKGNRIKYGEEAEIKEKEKKHRKYLK